MNDRFLNVYFVPLPDPIGINYNVTLHFVYDERNTPYLATPTINERVDDLLLRVGGKYDVTLSFTHVPAAPSDYQLKMAAAVAALEYFKGDRNELAGVDPSDLIEEGQSFKYARVVTIAEIAVYDESRKDAEATDLPIEDISDPLLKSLHCVQHFIDAYNLSADRSVRPPTYARVGPSIPVLRRLLTIERPDWTIHLQQLNHTNFGDTRTPKIVDGTTLAQILSNVQLLSAGDIRAIYRRALVEAQRLFLDDGDYSGSVVKSAQACEILYDGILGLMLWEESGGAPSHSGDVSLAADIFGGGLTSRIKKEYHIRLGGQWDPTANGPIGDWSRSIAGTRNRVVHRGYKPTADQAAEALNAADQLDDYVTERIASHARKYPRTALMWVGMEVLKERGRWALVRAFAQDRQTTEPPWRDNYAAWRERVDLAVGGGRRRIRSTSSPSSDS